MILTTAEYVERREANEKFDFDDAQTVASWWYSTKQPALVALATASKVLPSLVQEVELAIVWVEESGLYSENDAKDLRALLQWAKEN